MEKKYYFDDDEIGLAKNTSHPNFNQLVSEEFYYDLLDEFSPFGNDTGADTLMDLSTWIEENQNDANILEWMFNYIDTFGFKYQSRGIAQIEQMELINQVIEEEEFMINVMDQAIIATGFGQLKISGRIEEELKKITLKAMNRQIALHQQILSADEVDIEKIIKVVDGISTRPDEEGSTKHLTRKYIERMETMKKDITKAR